ncbi:MAG TPA: thioredoxin-dependent thiol peroxidase [Nitrospiria bacterium]|nr:thioredoxin-dependent thiol peroxidase [Nitrospiria bacterium]
MTLKAGDKAPSFTLQNGDGQSVSLDELRKNRWVVLYFYPKDDTPGCTKEACDFRDLHTQFQRAGAVIAGVSPDGVPSHQKFAAKHALSFPLLSDEGAKVATAYGLWKKKHLYGRSYMGIERTTFLISPEGRIAAIHPKVKVDGHATALLDELKALQQDRTAAKPARQ